MEVGDVMVVVVVARGGSASSFVRLIRRVGLEGVSRKTEGGRGLEGRGVVVFGKTDPTPDEDAEETEATLPAPLEEEEAAVWPFIACHWLLVLLLLPPLLVFALVWLAAGIGVTGEVRSIGVGTSG